MVAKKCKKQTNIIGKGAIRVNPIFFLFQTVRLTCEDVECLNGANCTDEDGGFDCLCDFGYTGLYCESGRKNHHF